MKLPRRQFLHLAVCAAVLPAVSRIAGASLSDAAGAYHCWFRACRHGRHRRASTAAVGTA